MPEIKVAVVGVGNCASALIQGVHYYSKFKNGEDARGIRNFCLGGLKPSDIKFVAAFDVDERKVGKDLSEAIFSQPNNTIRFSEVPKLDVQVYKGPLLDGIDGALKEVIKLSESEEVDVAEKLKESGAEIVIDLLPGGAEKASRFYAEESLNAGCAFINVTPAHIARDRNLVDRFTESGLPVIGDDLMDQVGATALHKLILSRLAELGVYIQKTYQLDVGGGTESLDTLERSRRIKRESKTRSVSEALPYPASIVAGSMDYVDFMNNRRDSYFWIKGEYFGGAPLKIDIKLSTVDGPNGGSVLLDVIRAVKIALERGLAGDVTSISAYAFKSPPKRVNVVEAEELFKDFIAGE